MGSPLAKPDRIGKYEIKGIIGRGGMGIVYRGIDPQIGRPVAIKILTAAFGNDDDLLARFYREARYTGTLQHPNIVTVYELGDQEGFPYLVMEYLEGESLESIIKSRDQISIAKKLGIIAQVCNGLSFAHKRGVVHRDIKAANIVVLQNGTAKIVDFGIAHVGEKGITRTGQVVGSILYMSPEQLNDSVQVDSRTDIYSTGVVLYQFLTGVLPFEGKDTGSTLLKIVQDAAPPLTQFLRLCPPELEAICQKALAKNRDQRYLTADDLAFDLVRVQQQLQREMVVENLQQAADAMEAQDLDGAKRHAAEVLRLDPQNERANRLMRDIHEKAESRQKRILEIQSQGAAALKSQDFAGALQCAEQGLQLDPDNHDFERLRDDARRSQARLHKIRALLKAAVLAAQNGNLEEARRAVAQALELQPDNAQAQELAAKIGQQFDLRFNNSTVRPDVKQFAFAVNTVEKAMADARMLRYLGQNQEAREALEKVNREVSQVNPELKSHWEKLRAELGSLQVSQSSAAPDKESHEEAASDFHATIVAGKEFSSPQTAPYLFPSQSPIIGDSAPQTASLEASTAPPDSETIDVPEELREFLPKPHARWRMPVLVVGILIAIAFGMWAYVEYWPKINHATTTTEVNPTLPETRAAEPAIAPSYVEINAEPWGRLREVASSGGEVVSQPDDYTPLRLNLHPGKYKVTLEGPGGDKKQLLVEVPEQGGNPYFIIFRKPDVQRILRAR